MTQDARPTRSRFVLGCLVAAVVATGLVYPLARFVFHDPWSGLEVTVFLAVSFVLYLVSPALRRFFRGPARK